MIVARLEPKGEKANRHMVGKTTGNWPLKDGTKLCLSRDPKNKGMWLLYEMAPRERSRIQPTSKSRQDRTASGPAPGRRAGPVIRVVSVPIATRARGSRVYSFDWRFGINLHRVDCDADTQSKHPHDNVWRVHRKAGTHLIVHRCIPCPFISDRAVTLDD